MEGRSKKRQPSEQFAHATVERADKRARMLHHDTSDASHGRNEPGTKAEFHGQGIQHSGQGNFNIRGNVSITTNSLQTNNNEAQDCLRDLFLTDPSDDRNALKRKKGDRAHGTCEWILCTEDLTAWLGFSQTELPESQATHVLWLYGNPGTGKSTMAIFLTEELSAAFSGTDGKTLAYFFCDSGYDMRKTATSIIRGLLFQLVRQNRQLLDYYLLPKYKERGAELFKSFDALWAIFMDAAADQATGRKYCIIDALDECDRESQDILLRQLRETFQSRNVPPHIRILITSRPYPEIREFLEEFANKNLASFPEAKGDIGRCIEERIAGLAKRKGYTNKVQRQVSEVLEDKADGTFLWVGLACEELENVPSRKAIQVLQDMPKGLHSLYKKLLDTAIEYSDPMDGCPIQRILSFVAVCLRPLSVLELSEACQLHQDEEDVETRIQFTHDQIASCRLMVIIQDEKVLLLHQSVKDFLAGAGAGHFINDLEAHAHLAYRCVNLLIKEYRDRTQSQTHFSEYATRDWANHARMAQSRFEVKASQAEFFEIHSPCREQWLERLRSDVPTRYSTMIPQQFSILHVAARWGVPALAHTVSSSDFQHHNAGELIRFVDCVDASGVTPLECAASSGYASVISVLLDLGGKVTAAVTQAAAGNSGNGKDVMALLLDRRGDEITITEEVVKTAAGNYRNGKKVMALLLDRRGDEISITEKVVSIIAKSFDKEIMELLLDRRGDEITITEEVVKAAAGNYGNGKKVMALLLDRRGDEITITEEVVKAAAGNSWNGKDVMELLLDRRGDEITITEEVVKAAATCGQDRVLNLLSQNGLISVRGEWRCIAKFYNAAEAGDVSVIKRLLDTGTKPDTKNINGETPLWIAARNRCDTVVQVLAQRTDVNVNSRSISGRSPLFWPSSHGNERILAFLMQAGADASIVDENGDTAVTVARRNGHERVAKVLELSRDLA
ncbi:Vegetative incompatibility protein HET-E-1 [Fusarium austroafricanum]|uniref:Vegetative incompatibility protein HET-E-1 n=1 Tax=Fusarium austroafricanum TaxID=2364996 RepID=A0A8H4KSI4_9HYPO|nr:Vegetative incompatibility protein HET-E-1 [Fusarium austroafricanum]